MRNSDIKSHIRDHVENWPASKRDVISAFEDMGDFDKEENKILYDLMPEKSYGSPDDVIKTITDEIKIRTS